MIELQKVLGLADRNVTSIQINFDTESIVRMTVTEYMTVGHVDKLAGWFGKFLSPKESSTGEKTTQYKLYESSYSTKLI